MEIVFRGKPYSSLKALADEYNIGPQRLQVRVRSGLSVEEAMQEILGTDANATTYTVDGVVYDSASSLARAYGVGVQMVRGRIADGWPPKCAVMIPPLPKGCTVADWVVYKGKVYYSRRSLCKELGITETMVNTRMASGWSLEEAVSTPLLRDAPPTAVVIGGVKYPNKQAAYDAYNIPKHAVLHRMRAGMTMEDAITTPWEPPKSYLFQGKEFSSIAALAEYCDCPIQVLAKYIEEEDNLDDACEKALQYEKRDIISTEWMKEVGCPRTHKVLLQQRFNSDNKKVRQWLQVCYTEYNTVFHDKTYKSVQDACTQLDLSVKDVRARMMTPMSFQEAIHSLYYVYDGIPYKTVRDLAEVLNVSRPSYSAHIVGLSNHDDVVSMVLKYGVQRTTEAVSLSIRKSNSNVASVVNLRDGTYMVYCSVCGRPQRLSVDDAKTFTHDDEACEKRTYPGLDGVAAGQLREQIRLKGGFEQAMACYTSSPMSAIMYRINQLPDVSRASTPVSGYVLIRCARCGKSVMLYTDEAIKFVHSDVCRQREWEPLPDFDRRTFNFKSLFTNK